MAWTDRWLFARLVAGTASTTGPSGPWIRAIPLRYDDDEAGTALYAKSLVIQPAGEIMVPNAPIKFTNAIVTVTFGSLDWGAEIGNDPFFLNSLSQDPEENHALQFATQEVRWGKEWYEVPNSSTKFKSDDKKINGPLRRSYNVHHMVITWHRYPVMPMTLVRDYSDSVNDATFLGCNRGTVYFEGINTVREQLSDGTITQRVQMTLKWRQFDWNKSVREDGFTWDLVVDDASGNEIYPYRDFSKLLLKGPDEDAP